MNFVYIVYYAQYNSMKVIKAAYISIIMLGDNFTTPIKCNVIKVPKNVIKILSVYIFL